MFAFKTLLTATNLHRIYHVRTFATSYPVFERERRIGRKDAKLLELPRSPILKYFSRKFVLGVVDIPVVVSFEMPADRWFAVYATSYSLRPRYRESITLE